MAVIVEPDPVLEADAVLRERAPGLWRALSPLGRRLRQPANFLPLQSAQARGKTWNATIGQITDGRGRAVPLPAMAAALGGLDDAARSQAFLYSPVEGLADLRRLWRERQRRGLPDAFPSSLPLVTLGAAQARALVAELFVPEGRAVVLPEPCRPGDRDLFALRLGARRLPVPLRDGRLDREALARALAGLTEGKPALLLLPGEAAPVAEGERASLVAALAAAAMRRPVVAIVDDALEGLEAPEGPRGSLFWDLIGRHADLLPVKADGADGFFPGGAVGFLTFPFEPGSPLAQAIETKFRILLRATVGSPAAATQALLIQALRREAEAPLP
jgi:DNA-binding transcriptional MocR family regulator